MISSNGPSTWLWNIEIRNVDVFQNTCEKLSRQVSIDELLEGNH